MAKKKKPSKTPQQEIDELEQAFEQVTNAANGYEPEPDYDPDLVDDFHDGQAPEKKKKSRKPILITVIVILILGIGAGIWWFLDYTRDDGLIYSNVYAAGLNLGGLTPDEAKAQLHTATDNTYTHLDLTVNLPDTTLILTPADTGAQLDVDTLVQAAYDYGREGNRWQNTKVRLAAAATSHTIDMEDCLTLDTQYIRRQVDILGQNAASTLTQTTVTVDGEVPPLDRTLGEATSDESVVHKTITIVKGTPERSLDTDALYETILNAYYTNDYTDISMEYHIIEPDAIDLQALHTEHCIAPTDAILDEETFHITPEVLGYGFNTEELQTQLDAAQEGEEIVYSFEFVDAELTLRDLEEYLFQDKLAGYSSNHTAIANRTNNLVLACRAIDGTVIYPGEVFSFNSIVGERTSAKGYKSATVYVGGKNEDQLGGGVCQVASTIYYCALVADLEIVERKPHQFMVDYVPRGMDATIYWGSIDFKFRNNTNYPIRINASTHDGQCHISLYGTEEKDYYIKMTYNTVSGPTGGGTEYEEFTSENNPKGYYDGQVIQTAYSGYVIDTYKNKYDKATDELISTEKVVRSTFSSRPRIVAKKVDSEPEETTPPAPTEEPTTPPTTQPTTPPTQAPTTAPTTQPTQAPTTAPTTQPTEAPTTAPTTPPTEAPTTPPTEPPTETQAPAPVETPAQAAS